MKLKLKQRSKPKHRRKKPTMKQSQRRKLKKRRKKQMKTQKPRKKLMTKLKPRKKLKQRCVDDVSNPLIADINTNKEGSRREEEESG
jgi:hypothetical protein